MKITQVKGDGKSLKNIELNLVMATIGHGEYSREIGLLRESLISIMPGNKNIHAGKIPVLMFAALFRKKDNSLNFSVYNGLVLVQVNNLADSGEVARIKKLASEAPQTLAAFTGSSGKSVKILLPFTFFTADKRVGRTLSCVGLPSCGELLPCSVTMGYTF